MRSGRCKSLDLCTDYGSPSRETCLERSVFISRTFAIDGRLHAATLNSLDPVPWYGCILPADWEYVAMDLTIGRVAELAGVGVETVRFYQRKGLVEEPPRRGSHHRRYSTNTVARIRFIRGAQNLGFSLSEIDGLLELRLNSEADQSSVKARAEAKVEEIDQKLADLQRMRDRLLKLIGACEGMGPLEDCPILGAFDQGIERTDAAS